MLAMIRKEFRELRRDRRTVAMLVALPILLLVIFGYAANFDVTSIRTEVYGEGADQVASVLPDLFDVTDVDTSGTSSTAEDALRADDADVIIVTSSDGAPTAYVNGSDLFTAQAASAALGQAAASAPDGAAPTVDVLFNPELQTSWVMVPALVGLILAFIGTIVTSLGLVRERQEGTLEQLAVMPFRPSDVIVGKIAPYFLLAAVDMVIVTVVGTVLFGVPFAGNVALFAIGAALFLLVVLGIGVLISTASQNQGQAIQAALMLLMPQILLSGMIFPLSSMPWGVRWIGYVLPLTWFIEISQGIMLRGAGLSSLWPAFAVLAAMAAVVFGAAIGRFRRDLAPGGASA
ncbi:MAG: ABC transporter permease [Acidimicrobiales bacterium]|nr:ABC transporter permease [Acidimicrobiales bacterium]